LYYHRRRHRVNMGLCCDDSTVNILMLIIIIIFIIIIVIIIYCSIIIIYSGFLQVRENWKKSGYLSGQGKVGGKHFLEKSGKMKIRTVISCKEGY